MPTLEPASNPLDIARIESLIDDRFPQIHAGGRIMSVDFSIYVAIIATLGEPGFDAVTTNLNINFLTKPEPRDLISSVRLIRVGRRLAVGEAQIYSEGVADMVALAIANYALPPR
jgi:acyl-coenzyme A thioesterase PaaI-like protein